MVERAIEEPPTYGNAVGLQGVVCISASLIVSHLTIADCLFFKAGQGESNLGLPGHGLSDTSFSMTTVFLFYQMLEFISKVDNYMHPIMTNSAVMTYMTNSAALNRVAHF